MPHPHLQNLAQFRVPKHFRGRPGWYVQLWWLVQALLIQPSPQVCYGWRHFWLRAFGAQVGKHVIIRPSVRITYPWQVSIGDYAWVGDRAELYSLGPISIGAHAVVSQDCYLCAGSHDYTQPSFPLTAAPIVIEAEAWLAAGCFIAPGVTVGHGAVVGARAVVLKDIPACMVAAGHPAKIIKPRKKS